MLETIKFYSVLGIPLFLWFGIFALLLFFFTAVVGWMNHRGIRSIPFKWHRRASFTALTLATIHAILALSSFF